MNKLEDLALIVPIQPGCPLCGTFNLPELGSRCTTLVGGRRPGEPDPNHTWTEATCAQCNGHFTIETKSGNEWHTKRGRVLEGKPNCFEKYIYSCKHCKHAGNVTRQYMEMDGETPLRGGLRYGGPGEKYQRTFYSCDCCHRKIEVDEGL